MLFAIATALAGPEVAVDLHGMIQARTGATQVEDEPLRGYARLGRVRALGNISVGERLRAQIQTEFVGGFALLDARVDGIVTPWLQISAGQAIVPYSRAWNTPLPVAALGDRSAANNALSPGRRVGAYARMTGGPVTAWVGLYDATPPPDLLGDVHAPLGVARIQVASAEARPNTEVPSFQTSELGVAVGAGVGAEPVDGDALLRATIDATMHVGGFSVLAEAFSRSRTGQPSSFGGSVQLGQFLVPRRFAVHGRVTALGEGATDEVARVIPELGLTGYLLETHALLQVRARLGGPTQSLRNGEVVLRGQLAF